MEPRQELRKHLLNCHIAGFTYHDGCVVMDKLKIGAPLELVREDYNKYDPLCVAVYYKDYKLGYIPKEKNAQLSAFLDMGYADMFETRICRIDPTEHTEHQVSINVYLKRKERDSRNY